MRCYKCNSVLDSSDYCLKCGADVSVYKVVVKASNAYYNDGLQKAKVRDLTGAITSLKTSISINKNNIKSRNLLGLCYFEMGEVVMALSEWVVSKNIKPERNVAEVYIKRVQNNPNKLDSMNQAIRKFNLSLSYAQEGNDDIALIQLKKVVLMNPKLVKAQLLLGLMLWKDGQKERAKKTFANVLKIDRNNTLALKYLSELDQNVEKVDTDTEAIFSKKRRIPQPLSGHDTIIPSKTYREPSNGVFTVLSILLGVIIGAALVRYLILPAKISSVSYDNNQLVLQYNEQLAASSVDIANMRTQIDKLTTERDNLSLRLEGYVDESELYVKLIDAAKAYVNYDFANTIILLDEIDVAKLPSQTAKDVYNTMAIACNGGGDRFFAQGTKAYLESDYLSAINYFKAAVIYDDTNDEAAFNLGKCYAKEESVEFAIAYYEQFIEDYPDSSFVAEATERMETLKASIEEPTTEEE